MDTITEEEVRLDNSCPFCGNISSLAFHLKIVAGKLLKPKAIGVWTEPSLSSTDLAPLKSAKIDTVNVQFAWHGENGLYQIPSPEVIINTIDTAHATGKQVMAWISSQSSSGHGVMDISSAQARTAAVARLTEVLRKYNFDGIADDNEESTQLEATDLASYHTEAAKACNDMGKIYYGAMIAFAPPYMGSQIFNTIKVDRIQMMMYGYPWYPISSDDTAWSLDYIKEKFMEHAKFALEHSSSPVSLIIHSDHDAYPSLATSVEWITELEANLTAEQRAKYVGAELFWLSGMTASQWQTWSQLNQCK